MSWEFFKTQWCLYWCLSWLSLKDTSAPQIEKLTDQRKTLKSRWGENEFIGVIYKTTNDLHAGFTTEKQNPLQFCTSYIHGWLAWREGWMESQGSIMGHPLPLQGYKQPPDSLHSFVLSLQFSVFAVRTVVQGSSVGYFGHSAWWWGCTCQVQRKLVLRWNTYRAFVLRFSLVIYSIFAYQVYHGWLKA